MSTHRYPTTENNYQPLLVIAHLSNGFASNDPWSPALDAILAYWRLREQVGDEQFACQQIDTSGHVPVDGLPLAIERHGEWWWYRCSAPLYQSQAEFLRYFHRRFDAYHAEHYMQPQRGRVPTSSGPFKNFRLSARVTVCDRVEWYCEGDAAEVERLLRRCSAIGAKIGSGNGRVLRWEVRSCADAALIGWRPVPLEYAEARGIDGPSLAWGIRPPGRLACNQTICVMPGGDDHARRRG